MPARSGVSVLELKVPPVALVLIMGGLMWLGAAYAPGFHFQLPFQFILALAFGLLGVMACLLGLLEFRRAKTTVNPTKPQSTSALVRSGIYHYTRNPMYLGFLLLLAGAAAVTANVLSLLALPAFVLYMNLFQIKPEERALAARFGDAFKVYCSTVRRWI